MQCCKEGSSSPLACIDDYCFSGSFQWLFGCTCQPQDGGEKADKNHLIYGTLELFLKEYVTVLIQLVCFSRTQQGDFFTGPLILYMMLVSFGFPFLSSYLFFTLRMGPWYDQKWGLVGILSRLFQVGIVTCAHLLGAVTAWQFMESYDHIWRDSAMHLLASQNGTGLPDQTESWLFMGRDDDVDRVLPGLEECLNTLLFLVGLLHLMEADAGFLFNNVFYKTDEYKKKEEENAARKTKSLTGVMSNSEQTNISLATGEASNPQQNSVASTEDNSPHKLNTSKAIPTTFILHVCVLLAATSRAFPTAHGTPAITLYMYLRKFSKGTPALWRAMGGVGGAVLALWYYYFIYVWRDRSTMRGAAKLYLDNVINAPTAAFMRTELQLPNSMRDGSKRV